MESDAPGSTARRLDKYRHIAGATFPRHRRGVAVLSALAIVALTGVSLSGFWLLFTHSPDPSYVDYRPGVGNRLDQEPQTVASQIHDVFATATGLIALAGTGWFAYRIAHRIPLLGLAAFGIALFGSLAGTLVRFNIVKIEDQPLTAAESGYLHVFSRDLEYAVTEAGQVGPQLFQLIVVSHVATIPLLLGFAFISITRAIDRRHRELLDEPKRSWFTGGRA